MTSKAERRARDPFQRVRLARTGARDIVVDAALVWSADATTALRDGGDIRHTCRCFVTRDGAGLLAIDGMREVASAAAPPATWRLSRVFAVTDRADCLRAVSTYDPSRLCVDRLSGSDTYTATSHLTELTSNGQAVTKSLIDIIDQNC